MSLPKLIGIAVVVACYTATCEAAVIKSFVVRCVDRSEATNDDIFLSAGRDGAPVPWGKDHQAGTSRGNTLNMTDGGILTLNAQSLAELKFDKTLEVGVNENDVTASTSLGVVKIAPGDGKKQVTLKGEDFEYHVEYEVE